MAAATVSSKSHAIQLFEALLVPLAGSGFTRPSTATNNRHVRHARGDRESPEGVVNCGGLETIGDEQKLPFPSMFFRPPPANNSMRFFRGSAQEGSFTAWWGVCKKKKNSGSSPSGTLNNISYRHESSTCDNIIVIHHHYHSSLYIAIPKRRRPWFLFLLRPGVLLLVSLSFVLLYEPVSFFQDIRIPRASAYTAVQRSCRAASFACVFLFCQLHKPSGRSSPKNGSEIPKKKQPEREKNTRAHPYAQP